MAPPLPALVAATLLLLSIHSFQPALAEGKVRAEEKKWWEKTEGIPLTVTHPFSPQSWADIKQRRAEQLGSMELAEEELGVDAPWPEEGTLDYYTFLHQRDQWRMASRLVQNTENKGRMLFTDVDPSLFPNAAGDIPISLRSLSNNLYYAMVQLGEKTQPFLNVQIDTGSDLFWVYCNADDDKTAKGEYNFYTSTTGTKIGCTSNLCVTPQNKLSKPCDASYDACSYESFYADQSGTSGILVMDQLLINGAPRGKVVIGCAVNAQGNLRRSDHTGNILNGTDGLIGMGRATGTPDSPYPSIQMVLASEGAIPSNVFSVCLTHLEDPRTSVGPGGVLLLGNGKYYSDAQAIDMIGDDLYYVPLEDIAINGERLFISPSDLTYTGTIGAGGAGVVLDTGYTYGNLPTSVYNLYMSAMDYFLRPLGLERVNVNTPFPCYDMSGNRNLKSSDLPSAELLFKGGGRLALPQRNLFFTGTDSLGRMLMCLPISTTPGVKAFVIGDSWMRNNFFTFDIDNQKIYMSPINCTTGVKLTDVKYYTIPANQTRNPAFNSAPGKYASEGLLARLLTFTLSAIISCILLL